jgi:hypothetical protein
VIADKYNDFLSSDDTLQVYVGDMPAFTSKKDRLLPLVDFITNFGPVCQGVVIFDKVMGNAAALLAVKVCCTEVYSPLGSDLAVKTLDRYKIRHHLGTTVPFIMRDDGKDLCPMEQMSIGKGPEEFYQALKARIEKSAV